MDWKQVYLGLGGNVGNTCAIIRDVLAEIERMPEVERLRVSRLYRTTPVGDLPQDDYVNAAAVFYTTLDAAALHASLKELERRFGKVPKPKDHPRVIDLDLLFYDRERREGDLILPHPMWEERLFVLQPLSDLTDELSVPEEGGIRTVNLTDLLARFPNRHQETVTPIQGDVDAHCVR